MEPRSVYTIGESILDIIFKDEQPVTAKPGGAMLNSAVSLGRAGISVGLISEFGHDLPGEIISAFLKFSGVSTESIYRYKDGQTALSLAFLDEQHNASYAFYKPFPAKRLACEFPSIKPEDIVLFGSSYAMNVDVRTNLLKFIAEAKMNGAFIIYDPNFRKNKFIELETIRPWILENMSYADVVRGSDEDFKFIFSANNLDEALELTQFSQNSSLIYTSHQSVVKFDRFSPVLSLLVPKIEPVSTIGAGDAFNAGLIYSIMKHNIFREQLRSLNNCTWTKILQTGIEFASDVCMSLENYISFEFANSL